MPVALRKRSWEDHVTPHLGTRYSYDDLDLICWHGIANGNGASLTGPRERCASMPECRRRKPLAGSEEGDDGGGDGVPGRERILTSELMEVACPSGHTGTHRTNEGTDQVPGAGSMPTMTDKDMHQSPRTSPGHGSEGGPSLVFSDIPDEGHATGIKIVKNEVSIPGTLPTASEGSPNVCQEEGKSLLCSVTEDTPIASSLDKAKVSHTQPHPKKEVKIGPPESPETNLTEMKGGEGDLTDGVSVAMVKTSKVHPDTLGGQLVNSECLDFIQVSENVLPPDINPKAEALSSDSQSRCVVCRSENGGQLPHDLIVPTDLEAPWCFGLHKLNPILEDESGEDAPGLNHILEDESGEDAPGLNPILEVPSTESGEDTPGPEEEEGSDCPVSMVSTEPEDVTNGPVQVLQSSAGLLAEQGILGNPQIDELAEACEASETSQSNAEAKPKPQESPIRLRAQKSSREDRERERSRLDSMLLLIKKLEQLDQEIESALSSAPSHNATPTLKRRIVTEVDSQAAVEAEGRQDGPSRSLHARLRRSSSPRASKGPEGARPKAVTCAAFSEKDRAETEVKEACTWLRAAGFPQYAQLYEDGEFPIEISSVTQDHDFLDRDAIDALCRRLNTLNKCALMRLEITPQRKRSDDSDDDEPCAISGRWTFQRESRRWSRLDMDVSSLPAGGAVSDQPSPGRLLRDGLSTSAESVLTDVSERPEGGSQPGEGVALGPAPVDAASVCSSGTWDGPPSPLTLAHFPFQGRSASVGGGAKSTRSRAKSFLKRVESLRLRSGSGAAGRRRKKVPPGRLEIGVPVPKEGLDDEALRRFNCVDLGGSERSEARGRVACYSTQTSSGSAGSSQSETSSGSAVSTPSPVTRARSHSAAASAGKRAGMYLEGFDPLSLVLDQERSSGEGRGREAEPNAGTAHNNQRNLLEADERREDRVIYFYLPEDHKPGTFPRALADGRPGRRGDAANRRAPRRVSATSLDSRMSFYDNVPFVEMGDEEEEEEEEEPQDMGAEPKMEALQRGRGFQRLVSAWSSGDRGEEEEEEEEEEEDDSDSAVDSASPCPSSPSQRHLEEAENGSDQESGNNPPGEHDDSLAEERGGTPAWDHRSREPIGPLRWSSVLTSHTSSQLGCQSVVQMNLLHKYSLLKITALLEKHPPSSKQGFSWAVPKFMKRMKVRDFRGRSVFGVPLQVNVQRSGQPLPRGIQQAMFYLHHECLDQVGLFRKSGVKSRIQALRHMNESCGINGGGVSYEGQSAYDVADMLKQYFRDLPEPLLTSKLSDTFLQIYQYMPKEQWLQALRVALLLLPDENREVLLTLLCFLSDVTANAEENQMTCTNLAVCVAPSLFHLNTARRDASSPRMMSRKTALGKPDQRDLNENLAATHGLAHMIQECRRLFQIPEELSRCRKSYMEQALLPPRMEDVMEAQGYRTLVQESVDALLKEARERFRGYDSCSTHQHAELACKKVHDGWSLRQWKACVEVGAGPQEVLRRIMSEQSVWDENLLESRVLESLERTVDVYQYIRNSMPPHPPTDHVVLRSWLTDLPKGVCALVCVSVDHESAAVLGVRANVMTSRYYIEPCGHNKSRITHISRTDCRGRCPEWYNKLYGHLCVSELVRIRDSFIGPLDK